MLIRLLGCGFFAALLGAGGCGGNSFSGDDEPGGADGSGGSSGASGGSGGSSAGGGTGSGGSAGSSAGGSNAGGSNAGGSNAGGSSAGGSSAGGSGGGSAGGSSAGGSSTGGAAGSSTGGAAGASGSAGSTDAGPDCPKLLDVVYQRLEAAKRCCPACAIANQCSGSVPGVCCPETVNFLDSADTDAYLEAFDAWQQSGCFTACPKSLCPVTPSNNCLMEGFCH